MPKPETTVEDPQEEGLKTWKGKFINEIRREIDNGRVDLAFSANLSLVDSIAAEQAYQLSRIADALSQIREDLQHLPWM